MPKPEVVHVGRHLQFVIRQDWEFVQRRRITGVVAVIAMTPERAIVLVEQYREPLGTTVIELPAGLAGDIVGSEEEDLVMAARRELFEETGFEAEELAMLFCGPTSAGLTDETVTFFVGRTALKAGAGGGEDGEDITVHVVPLEQVDHWLSERTKRGDLVDPKIFAGLYLLQCNGAMYEDR